MAQGARVNSNRSTPLFFDFHDLAAGVPSKIPQEGDLILRVGEEASHGLPLPQGESMSGIDCFDRKAGVGGRSRIMISD